MICIINAASIYVYVQKCLVYMLEVEFISCRLLININYSVKVMRKSDKRVEIC